MTMKFLSNLFRRAKKAVTPPSDEPQFLLTAADPLSPNLVRNWAFRMESRIKSGELPDSDMPRVFAALGLASSMEKWRRDHS